jgi:Domain of unknown function (DUF4595) with porin-like fold
MKFFYAFSCFIIFFAGCKKGNDRTTCVFTAYKLFINGSMNEDVGYEYDNQGRVAKVFSNFNTYGYEYFPDSVVKTSLTDFGRTVYHLNNAGLADVATMTNPFASPGYRLDYVYTYDADGFLVQIREIFTQIHNGNTLHDTVFFYFTIQQGNIIKATSTQWSYEEHYEYATSPLPANNPVVNIFPSAYGKFMGKAPANLVSKIKNENGVVLAAFTYNFDLSGNLVKRTLVNPAPGGTAVTEFTYQCN